MKTILHPKYFLLILLFTSLSNAQTVLGLEDFDGNSTNLTTTSNVADYNAGGGTGGDVFGRLDGQLGGNGMPFDMADDTTADVSGARTGAAFPGDVSGIAGANTTAFFGLNDMDGIGINNATWTFEGWGSAVITDIQIDMAAMGDFEASSSDGFIIEASINGGSFQEIFRAETDESAFKTYRPLDGGFVFSDDDPLALFIDGSPSAFGILDKSEVATGNFDTYISTLLSGQTASSVTIRLRWEGSPSGSEPMGIDNITIHGAPNGSPELVISEIMYNPASTDDNWEWIEVYNAGTVDADISGYVLDDNNGTAHTQANIASGIIAAGTSAILYNVDDIAASDFMAAWGAVNLIPVTNWGAMSLNNSGDTVGLWESFASYSGDNELQANVLDNVVFDDVAPWPVDNGASSIYLTDLAASNDNGSNWALSINGITTPLFISYTSNAAGGNSGSDIGSPGDSMEEGIMPLLISEITVTPTAGEFIEIYNPNTTSVDLTHVYITDATFAGSNTYYYNIVTGANAGGGTFGDFLARFPDGASILPGEYQTISLAGSEDYVTTYGTIPTYELYEDSSSADAIPDMLEGIAGSINNQGGFTNGGEVAILFYWDGVSDLVTDLDYVVWGDKAEAVDKTGVSIDGPDLDADTSTYQNDTPIADQDVVATLSHLGGDSFQRRDLNEGLEIISNGNGSGGADETSEDLSNTWCASPVTAGTVNVCGPVITELSFIHEVQGSGLVAAMAGATVRVQAVVVGDYQAEDQLKGFFIQEEDADADTDTMTSEGIFVYCDSCATEVSVGDAVEVTGLAVDFFGMTQIDVTGGGIVTLLTSENVLPTPASISLPATTGTDEEGTFENVEGMLITFTTNLVVSEYFELARYGQLVLSAGERVEQFTDANEPDVAGYSAFLTQLEQSRIILDDDTNIQNDATSVGPDEPYFWPRPGLSTTNFIRGGDAIDNLTGIMHWSFSGQSGTDAWRIRPVEEAFTYAFAQNNPREDFPQDVGGTLKVASFNVLNYFTTLNSRGANSAAELQRQRAKIAAAVCSMDADIVGLIEIENNGVTAINDLLNGAGGINETCTDATYAAVDTGIIGTDQIAVAFIYNTQTVSLEGAFAVLDSSVDPRFNDTKNRPALAQTFKQISNNGVITVVVNHLKSKGSSCNDVGDPDINDGSANCNETRTQAAAAMVDWLETDPTQSGDADFLIIGDLNSYKNETPIDAIEVGTDDAAGTADDYTDLIEAYQGEDAYSYVFDGQLGYLDYALSSAPLTMQITGTTVWHISADEINVFDYNDAIQDAGEAPFERESDVLPVYEPNAFRASDHDPVLVGIDLGVAPTIECSSDIILNNDAGLCSAVATFTDATATDVNNDLVSIEQTGGPASGSVFTVGTTEIEFTAIDAAGNTVICTFNVIVNDTELPIAVCQDITLQLNVTGMATLTALDVDGGSTDNCGITSMEVSEETFNCSNMGVNMVTFTVTDDNGNINTCMAEVTVVDTISPEIICPADSVVTVEANETYELPDYFAAGTASATDNCTNPVLLVSQTPAVGTMLTEGEYTITLIAEDSSGNSNSCEFELTIDAQLSNEDFGSSLESITVFPNPVRDVIRIYNPNKLQLKTITIYGIYGRLISSTDLKTIEPNTEMDVQHLATGNYLFVLQGEGSQLIKHLVKK